MAAATATATAQPQIFGRARLSARDKAFRKAKRHSAFVRFLRVLLPVGGVAGIAVLALIGQFSSDEQFDLSIAKTTIAKNAIIMDNPKLTGFDRYDREFRLEADRAIQKFTSPDAVTLENITAHINSPGRGPVAIDAVTADFDNAKGDLQMGGNIVVDSADGYGLTLTGAQIDTKSGTLKSDNPVSITYQDSETTGNSIDATDGGQRIIIQGNVRTRIMPPKRGQGAAVN
ncbi:LPS export ABC transporter periplasmic protein LptC [Afifella marina]|uniref:Lipopolysaccharide export system protein LptC n=1 Tax=Afifella marina DSM 2698 TaxID=1120955 RepID=A0A1G5NDL2_AFIMA|nr:LPS export ABC transporter periplasmic protein LptC [Afifella marina]MBK1623239.1 LPS export ABC transporter periplasmic protein LptC [Afifella marina DSM 2698]MBK1626233.1 LPS export ABC transporter periplasmic protein LptC [Afifella marina]MBK5917111.1 LPS export ABC transporter periplasmic protein LptC [Afifella marina]RAI22097.1 LPS export ABC transporter periplasmic protein LptC [Afifella marina DSM 2698]SCZ34819.1 lipopolysaccharide export system protein LptC [Afifella marina DSM 2698